MSEGRTSAAEAGVDGEDHAADTPTPTGTTGAADGSGSAGSNGHDADEATTTGTTTTGTSSDTASGEASSKDEESADTTPAAETVPAATLPDDEAETTSSTATSTGTTSTGTTSTGTATTGDGEEEWADAEDKAYKKEMRKGFAFGAAGGILVGAIIALLLGALVWPGYLLGPGDPQDTANQVTQALSSKDAAQLDALSCKGENGQSVTQLSPQVLQYITKVAPAGPTTTLIQTEARTPVDLTLSVQGQTQTLPSELVLGETKGDWCLKGLAQRQQ
ncbi:MAG TPA: hypothetical protein VGH76_26760 [Actinomycetospora sp.]|uniref:hypothetical protein n=1 Tax=Actinomycetospora sp. TaxID=1872135 RepID=UPI002F42CCB4